MGYYGGEYFYTRQYVKDVEDCEEHCNLDTQCMAVSVVTQESKHICYLYRRESDFQHLQFKNAVTLYKLTCSYGKTEIHVFTCFFELTLNYIIPSLLTLQEKAFEYMWAKEKMLVTSISPFSTIFFFFTLTKIEIII